MYRFGVYKKGLPPTPLWILVRAVSVFGNGDLAEMLFVVDDGTLALGDTC